MGTILNTFLSIMWSTIESDPGVFTELITKLGAKDILVKEIYDLETLQVEKEMYGLIFLHKWSPIRQEISAKKSLNKEGDAFNVFFAKQMIDNVCATQAILSIIFNQPKIVLNNQLANFKEKVSKMSYEERGRAIGDNDFIKNIHNSFNTHGPFYSKTTVENVKNEESFHFVSIMMINNCLYEL